MSEAENIQRLRAIRGAYRGVATKLLKEVDDILTNASLTTDSGELKTKLNTLKQQIECKLTKLNEVDQKILGLCDIKDIGAEVAESEDIFAKVTSCIVRLESAVNKCEVLHATSGATSSIETPNIAQQQMATQVRAKLPKMTLQKFKGNVTNWKPFWESFKAAVHDNDSISKVDKFNYLHSHLEGSAARSVQGLTLTEANYEAAVAILEERFGRPQQIIAAHMDELLKLQPCSNERSSSIRFVYDKIRVHVRGLDSLGVTPDQYGSLLIPVVMSKLPNSLRLEVARRSTNEIWKIDELLETIRKEIEAREASDQVKLNDPKPPTFERTSKPGLSTAQALLAKDNTNTKILCVYCGELHYSASCDKIIGMQNRKDILRRDKRCFVCLRIGHVSRECANVTGCRKCGQRHHQSICILNNQPKPADPSREKRESPKEKRESPNPTNPDNRSENTTATMATSTSRKGKAVLLQTARCIPSNVNNTRSTGVRVLFDTGSQRTYVTNHLKSRLALKPMEKENLRLNTLGDDRIRKETCDVVKLSLRKGDGEKIDISALSFPVICSSLPLGVDVSAYKHIDGLNLADEFEGREHDSIDVLIGSDYYWCFITGETVQGDYGPTAVNSRLGWLLSGPVDSKATSSVGAYATNLIISGDTGKRYRSANEDDDLTSTLKQFWETESIGVRGNEDLSTNQLPESFLKNIKYTDNRYEVSNLPWKEERTDVKTDYNYCYNRLKSLQYRLKKEPELLDEYNNTIKDQLEKGVVEEVPPEELGSLTDHLLNGERSIHYMPHHAVVCKDKDTTKLRVVYDGSAKSDGEGHSLNESLETGPNFIPHLFDVLVRFRWNPVVISADIEKAFLTVGIDLNDRDMLRFLWLEDPQSLNSRIKHLRFCRLVFGLRPSPAILGATMFKHLNLYEDQYPELVELIRKSLYVDDFLSGGSDDNQAFDIYQKSKEIMSQGGFNLRKWQSNSCTLLESVNQFESDQHQLTGPVEGKVILEDETYAKSTIGPTTATEGKSVKVLGVNWNTGSHELFFKFDDLITFAKCLPVTKRSLLKLTAKIFDPLGLLSPFTIRLKTMFQILCCDKIDWDEELQGTAVNGFVRSSQIYSI